MEINWTNIEMCPTMIVEIEQEECHLKYHDQKIEDVIAQLSSDVQAGLSDEVVKQRQAQYGENRLKEKEKKSNLQRFLDQFKDVMILILIGAALISFTIACMEGNMKEFFEPVLIMVIVIANALIGVAQENKAEKALDALKGLSALHARVIRNQETTVIDASELVPGDIIHLEAGDFVPADARLLKSMSLKSEESALTGESLPSQKDAQEAVETQAALGDRHNMVFSGCSITYGTATAIVTAIGMDSEMGKIANLLDQEEQTQTPLQQKLAQLGKYLGILALGACVIIFGVGILNGIPALEIFMTAVSLAVSAIPEGLPAIVTVVLSIGVQRMVKRNAIIRSLPAVETLGSASVICSDKTGTLTQNRMTLVKAYVDGMKQECDVKEHEVSEEIKQLLRYGALCCDGTVVIKGEEVTHIGDPTETAIVLASHLQGSSKEQLNTQYPRIAELPFDSDRKLMTTVHEVDGTWLVIVKGAFDMMKERCITGDLNTAQTITEQMSKQALRVLAIGYKTLNKRPSELTTQALEEGLTFFGLVGMIDPPREEAKVAVATCRKAGIKPVMITGDHIVTASAIAKQLGIYEENDRAITGSELDAMSDEELDQAVTSISVYARVSPENKIRIVKAWQKRGDVVAMTGDGVNDAPALKAADIGCAMGITGTDVAKGAADMTLTDDNFATIVEAVNEGRGVYANIKKVVGFLLGTNIGEVITVFFAMILWHKTPLLSMQLLWINLVTDSMPAIALGMEDVEADVMKQSPKPKQEGLFAHGFGVRIVLQGCMFGILTLVAFRIGEQQTQSLIGAQTMAFIVLSLSQVVQAFNMRSEHSLFKIGIFSNQKLNFACLLSLVLVGIVLFTPLATAFGLCILPLELYGIALFLVLVPLLVMEVSKAVGLIKHHH